MQVSNPLPRQGTETLEGRMRKTEDGGKEVLETVYAEGDRLLRTAEGGRKNVGLSSGMKGDRFFPPSLFRSGDGKFGRENGRSLCFYRARVVARVGNGD